MIVMFQVVERLGNTLEKVFTHLKFKMSESQYPLVGIF